MTDRARAIEAERHTVEASRLWRLVKRREAAASVSETIAQRGRGVIEASIREVMGDAVRVDTDPDDCIDWLRGRLTALTEIGELLHGESQWTPENAINPVRQLLPPDAECEVL